MAESNRPNTHIAQGSALGKHYTPHLHSPCKGKSLIIKVLPLQGALLNIYTKYPGRCPGLCDYWAFSPHSIQASPFSKYYYKTLINKPI